jgi:hypothetical protein
MDEVLKVAVIPAGAVYARATVPEKPFSPDRKMVEMSEPPCDMVREDGLAERLNTGPMTVTPTSVVSFMPRELLVPVIFTL